MAERKMMGVKVSEDERELMQAAADAADLSLTTWVRTRALKAARDEVEPAAPER